MSLVSGLIIFLFIIIFLIPYVTYKFGTPGHGLGLFQPDVSCPNCGILMPRNRSANSARQMFFGGWTCHKCGCEIDGFGKKR